MIARVLVIFRKDARRLWPYVLMFWVVMFGGTALNERFAREIDWSGRDLLRALPFLQWLACWLLVVLLIQQEQLVGHEQYWLARPIAWQEMVAAKALFLVTMLYAPISICHQALWGNLLPDQGFVTAFMILPAAAFAAVTRNLGQAVLALIGAFMAVAILSSSTLNSRAPGLLSGLALYIAPVTIAVILLQYSRRREVLARCILVAGVAGLVVSMRF